MHLFANACPKISDEPTLLRSPIKTSTIYIFRMISEGMDVSLSYDVAFKQWITSCHKSHLFGVTDNVGIKNAFSY